MRQMVRRTRRRTSGINHAAASAAATAPQITMCTIGRSSGAVGDGARRRAPLSRGPGASPAIDAPAEGPARAPLAVAGVVPRGGGAHPRRLPRLLLGLRRIAEPLPPAPPAEQCLRLVALLTQRERRARARRLIGRTAVGDDQPIAMQFLVARRELVGRDARRAGDLPPAPGPRWLEADVHQQGRTGLPQELEHLTGADPRAPLVLASRGAPLPQKKTHLCRPVVSRRGEPVIIGYGAHRAGRPRARTR